MLTSSTLGLIFGALSVAWHLYQQLPKRTPPGPVGPTPPAPVPARVTPAPNTDAFNGFPGLPGHPFLNGLSQNLPLLLQLLAGAKGAMATPGVIAQGPSAHDQAAIALLAPLARQNAAFMAAITQPKS